MYQNAYPVVENEISSGVYHPLPYYSEDDWKNKNRHPWKIEDVEALMRESFGTDAFYPTQNNMCVLEINPAENSKLLYSDHNTSHHWNIGRIIALGPLCFETRRFPKGAAATIGDYIVFDSAESRIKFATGSNLLRMKDYNVLDIIRNPDEYANAGQ